MGNVYFKNRRWKNPCRALSWSVLVHLTDLELRPESSLGSKMPPIR